ncbi:MAG: hypothetical protein DCF15_12425 [Phormidesmis priestleyi]|uniref:Uncharacterized protein n=1 Tax=Phormidesmis priestleyi TaxID=268141 RepID=A0A2W4X9V2_9CYAN|nr:MAG: hypothetical protein DCF15_12425 [Phormidesmis priestleyi]
MDRTALQPLKAYLGLAQGDRKAVAICTGWAMLSASAFLLVRAPWLEAQPEWFPVVVSLLKVGAFLIATLLCWRNANDPLILSGRSVWQAIAVSMACYTLGGMTVILWRSVWGITSTVSLGDVFYGASYLFLAIGLLLAVIPRQIGLNWAQSLGIAITGILGIVLAFWLNFQSPAVTLDAAMGPSEAIAHSSRLAPETVSAETVTPETVTPEAASPPAVVKMIDQRLHRVSDRVGLLYVGGDCVLVVTAAALLVTFWGGSYSEAWKLIALAGLCLYVADMFWMYEVSQGRYQLGAPWEFFWILSALLFGLGASVELGVTRAAQRHRPRCERL